MRFLRHALRRRVMAVSGLVLGLAVAGCDSQAARDASDSTIGLFRTVVGSDDNPDELNVDPGAPPPPVAARCPSVVIREGTETYRVYDRGFEGDPGHVVYQGGVTKVARECEFIGPNAVRIKFGVAGRVVTGPSWANGPVELPLRAAFVKTGGEAVWSQLYNVQLVILPGDPTVQFTQVEENLYYEFPEGEHINNYVIYVGFDELADGSKRG